MNKIEHDFNAETGKLLDLIFLINSNNLPKPRTLVLCAGGIERSKTLANLLYRRDLVTLTRRNFVDDQPNGCASSSLSRIALASELTNLDLIIFCRNVEIRHLSLDDKCKQIIYGFPFVINIYGSVESIYSFCRRNI